MDSIHDYCEQLSIGSLVQCTFEDGKRLILPVRGLRMAPEKEVLVAVPDSVKSPMIDCLPATITEETLKRLGFSEGLIYEDKNTEFEIIIKHPLKLIIQKVTNGERFYNIFLSKISETEDESQFFFVSRARYLFKIQDIYRTFANKPLVWKR